MKKITPRTRKGFLLGAGMLVLLALVVIIAFGFPESTDSPSQIQVGNDPNSETAPEEDAFAPDFELFNLEGKEVQLSEFKGQPVLINFWATWCAPCRIEMPAIQDCFERLAENGFAVLTVNYDESLEEVQAFADELELTFDLLLDPGGEIQRRYRIRGYPTSLFVDSNGVIQVLHIGVMTESQLDTYLAQIGLEK
jgi:cytochrome c biogenesis protein CcmG/thiol:disulfide interchange protein DsbE